MKGQLLKDIERLGGGNETPKCADTCKAMQQGCEMLTAPLLCKMIARTDQEFLKAKGYDVGELMGSYALQVKEATAALKVASCLDKVTVVMEDASKKDFEFGNAVESHANLEVFGKPSLAWRQA